MDVPPLAGIRTILIRPDLIVARPQRAPVPVKQRTPCRPRPEGDAIERPGGREWFSEHVFVEAQDDCVRSGFGTSTAVHASVIVLTVVLAAPFERTHVRAGPPAIMPAIVFIQPPDEAPSLSPPSRERSRKASTRRLAALPGAPPAAPVEAPARIEDEADTESGANGIEGGVAGGSAGGLGDGTTSAGMASAGPLRIGGSIRPPRKTKDVKPVYPQSALSGQARGTVVVDVTIGIDGKVQHATVLHSVPWLDSAALEAVRQWEYEPTVLNGALVTLIMTVVVNFTIQ